MSQLEKAMGMIIDVFDKYSATQGNKFTLSKGELKTLLQKEMPNFLESAKDKDALDKLMKELDENGDSELDFNEFIILVAACTCIGHSYFEKHCPQ